MYLQHFQLHEPPFSIAPNPRYLYLGKRHQEALAHLIFGLRGEGGIVVLTGEVGTGKTTISRKILEDIPASTDVAWIVNPKLSALELLATICDELHIPYPEDNSSIKVFTDKISKALLDAHAAGRNTVLMIDEAQNLSPEVLEQLRLLTNLETSERKLLQIVLLGQDELKDILDRHDMRQLAQRVTARYHLSPLTRSETVAYIRHRLHVAGCDKSLFRKSAMADIHRISRGIPRLINLICDRALLGAYAGGRAVVESKHVRQAAREVLGSAELPRPLRPVLLGSALAVLLGIGAMQSGALFSEYASDAADPAPTASSSPLSQSTTPLNAGSASAKPSKPADPDGSAMTETAVPEHSFTENTVSKPSESPPPAAANPWQEINSIGSQQLAYQTLARLWIPDISLSAEQRPCEQLKKRGLQCLHQRGGWGMLRSLNRPAVLRLTNPGSDRYVTLSKMTDATATLQLGDKKWQVSLHELEQHWFAEFTLLWKTPPGFSDTLRPGDAGQAVNWLAQQLDRIQGQLIPAHNSTYMDAVLVSRVKDFQRSHGLNPDGAAGPLTLIQLNEAVQLPGPRLLQRETD